MFRLSNVLWTLVTMFFVVAAVFVLVDRPFQNGSDANAQVDSALVVTVEDSSDEEFVAEEVGGISVEFSDPLTEFAASSVDSAVLDSVELVDAFTSTVPGTVPGTVSTTVPGGYIPVTVCERAVSVVLFLRSDASVDDHKAVFSACFSVSEFRSAVARVSGYAGSFDYQFATSCVSGGTGFSVLPLCVSFGVAEAPSDTVLVAAVSVTTTPSAVLPVSCHEFLAGESERVSASGLVLIDVDSAASHMLGSVVDAQDAWLLCSGYLELVSSVPSGDDDALLGICVVGVESPCNEAG